ncbi:GNAT family N-acetyltransferase [Streptococcus parasanguinis]|uniref:GNAT family N-acetyltransferase n=1 Tax=Streptococcus parasanguinis TaxID=1318 RepID=UPI0039C1EA3B
MFRKAKITDIDKLVEIVKTYQVNLENDALEELERLILDENSSVIIFEKEEIIAFMAYKKRKWGAEDIYWLEWLFVNQKYSRKGYGKKIYDYVENSLIEFGARKLYVDIENNESDFNKLAEKFHLNNGYKYEATLKDFWSDGQDYVLLSKRLM